MPNKQRNNDVNFKDHVTDDRTLNSDHQADDFPRYAPLLFSVLMGVLGAIINSQALPFLPEIHLIFGNAVFVIVAMRLAPKYSVLCAFIAVIPLYFYFGHPFGFLTFGLEAYVIAKLRIKGWYVLFADMAFWLVIGMPLTCAIIFLTDTDSSYWLFISLKQGFNAALYTSIACLIAFFLDKKLKFSWQKHREVQRNLRQQMVYAIVLIAMFTLVSSTFLLSRNLLISNQNIVESALKDNAQRFANMSDVYLNNQKNAIRIASKWLSAIEPSQHQQVLTDIHQSYSGFLTMLITDIDGVITNASPDFLLTDLPDHEKSVADRDYFQKALFNQSLYVSPVFRGRGFGTNPIIAISAPIYHHEMKNAEMVGVVEGSLDLSIVSTLNFAKFDDHDIDIVLVDHHNNVIFSSKGIDVEPLLLFDYTDNSDNLVKRRMIINSIPDKEFAYASARFADNWRVYSLLDYKFITNEINRQYTILFITLFIALVIAALIANQYGKRLTRPLKFIIRQLNKPNTQRIDSFKPFEEEAAKEITQLYDEFKTNRYKVIEYQEQLEEKVIERTAALNDANTKLQKLALNDGLTKVRNRRYLDDNFDIIQKTAHRNAAIMAIVMLDIDHFKALNDRYGHLNGDVCLQRVAELIKDTFHRETDIVVRFGGEEFLIVVPYVTAQALKNKLENLRLKIMHEPFVTADGDTFQTSASFGAYIDYAEFSKTLQPWVKIADLCLYKAKESGRNKVIIDQGPSLQNKA